jgi:hypothetical protein
MTNTSRRSFFRGLGGLGGASLLAAASSAAQDKRSPITGSQRQETAYGLRASAASSQRRRPPAAAPTNGDEALYPGLIANFTKGFLHTQLGEIDRTQGSYQALLYALSTEKHSDFEKIPIGYVRTMVNPESSFAYDMDGGDSHTFDMIPPPAFASAQAAADMVELYWQALARDVPFAQWDSSPVVQAAASELNKLSGYAGPRDASGQVTPDNLFRGTASGCRVGPYVSQYLLQTIYFGSTPREQMYRTGVVGADYLTSYDEWLQIQDGIGPYRQEVFDPTFRYIHSGRDFAQFVHYDYTYQTFLQAALIILDSHPETLLNFNTYQLSASNPYKASRVQTSFTTFGSAHILDLMARASNIALQPACWHKWAIHRRVRPEEFGGCVYNTLAGLANYPIHSDLMNSKALQTMVQSTGLALLPQAYVEGCPIHPSYPAGHAAIAGACATILKAFFFEGALVSGAVAPSADGLSLMSADGLGLTLGGELDKLAFNIPMGRDWAGIHYRSDVSEGLKLGEAVAISILQDQVGCVTETFTGFQFTQFDGTPVVIAAQGS